MPNSLAYLSVIAEPYCFSVMRPELLEVCLLAVISCYSVSLYNIFSLCLDLLIGPNMKNLIKVQFSQVAAKR